MDSCWICNRVTVTQAVSGGSHRVKCERCGPYLISSSLSASQNPLPDKDRHRLSYWCRQRLLDDRALPELNSYSIEAIIATLPSPHQAEKADILLLSLGKAFAKPGQALAVDWDRDYSLACAIDGAEFKFHFRSLRDRGWIDNNSAISHDGWAQIEKLASTPNASKTAFIAMHFSSEMLAMWKDGFGAAVTKAGFDPVLANYPDHNEQIDAKIIAEIKQARFIVADVTGARTGVYFEAGYAIGIGRPVIWTCRSDRHVDMHFDTRQYNHILWNDAEDLRDQLYYRIVATI